MVFLLHCATLVIKGWNQSGKKVVICHFCKARVEKDTSPFSFDIEARGCTNCLSHYLWKPIRPSSVMSFPGELKNHHEESKGSCPCFPKSSKGTLCQGMDVSNNYVYIHTVCRCKNTFYYTDSVLENKICPRCNGISLSSKFIANYLV